MSDYSFVTPSGILVTRNDRRIDFQRGIEFLVEALDRKRGAFLSSGVEDQDRYTRWDFGFIDPPLELIATSGRVRFNALNPRGIPLLAMLKPVLLDDDAVELASADERHLELAIAPPTRLFSEEERSRQPSVMTPIRRLLRDFEGFSDAFLGLYGAFGHDLIFEFDPMPLRLPRGEGERLMHLYLPDRILVMDRRLEVAWAYEFEFERRAVTTVGQMDEAFAPLDQTPRPVQTAAGKIVSDHTPDEYMTKVDAARERMRAGDIFEVVLSQSFSTPYAGPASEVYRMMRRINPSPYEFFFQFGADQLIGASPEMFVRVEGRRVESSPIAGTARRGANAMEDADRIKALYDSEKDEVELTMCTDVDRNDKARICEAGSVKLLSRRMIERYAGLFHTVDHVEGRLREGFDGIDAFLSHMWAVTLTGAPKRKAVEIVEQMESTSRAWYGGAIGALMLSGTVNTGITIRTVHLREGQARYRAGATLVFDSVPAEEQRECEVKATSFFRAMATLGRPAEAVATTRLTLPPHSGVRIVMVDNEDSFVHTLADYFRQTGAEVKTFRHGAAAEAALADRPDLVVHSPGPGRPAEFGLPGLVGRIAELGIPQFGVCLGLQGIVEAFGGELGVLEEPRHGKYWSLQHDGSGLFDGIDSPARVGAYHSLYAVDGRMPAALEVVARNEDGLVMAVRHRELPIAAVQFHPESILTLDNLAGHRMVENAVGLLTGRKRASAAA